MSQAQSSIIVHTFKIGGALTDHFILIEGNYLKNVEEARSHSSDA